ncbi:NAD(P)/FAD-dependent oxidoreductase [Halobaculum sp. P14]|uniref:NAD(P)/FAD-dependent oxidoreductase n=1 Tax=Halobaculum sp. P14 TaxID=3421638 RepID=UPI003EBF9823
MSPERVAVVGAGAVGVTAAYDLAARGADVTVFERGDRVAAASSGRAAGVLYDAYAEDVDAELGARSMERFRSFSGDGGFRLRECPYVMLARDGDDARAEAIDAAAARMRQHGRDVDTVSGAELGRRFPALRTDDVAAAAVASNAGWTDPASYVELVARKAVDAGAELRLNAAVSVSTSPPAVTVSGTGSGGDAAATRPFDAVVVAAGAHTAALLGEAGVALPLKPYRVQALVGADGYDGPMCYDATAGVYFRPHPDGLLGGDGTVPEEADPDDWDRDGDDWFVADTREVLRHRADYDAAPERAWAGLCTATPDGDPLVGAVADGVYVAAGWQGHGFMRAPATGELVAEQVLGERDGPASFDPTRFDGDREFEIREGMVVEERREASD